MTEDTITGMSAIDIGAAIKDGRLTSFEAAKAFLDAIEAKDREYHSYITGVPRGKPLSRRAKPTVQLLPEN